MRRDREQLVRRRVVKKHGARKREQVKECRCNSCGTVTHILRPARVYREPGHQKHLWCLTCQTYCSHTEL